MSSKRLAPSLGLLVLFIASEAPGQTPAPPTGPPTVPGLRKLSGDDEKRAAELDQAIEAALKAGRWDEAIERAAEGLALRTRVLGPTHYDTVSDEWLLKALRRVATMPIEDRVAFQSADTMSEQALTLATAGKPAQARPLFEKAMEIRRRLLTDDHPLTALTTNQLGNCLDLEGKYDQARPLLEKALEVRRRLLTENHPDTAASYNAVATNLYYRGKYEQAQPLYEKMLELRRRFFADEHLPTAVGYGNVGTNLVAQGKYALAQPFYEKALEIKRRLLGDHDIEAGISYGILAFNLDAQGKYALAQPLHEKALEVRRRHLTDDHPLTANAYHNLAGNLAAQGKYAAARPLEEMALAICSRRLTDEHPYTAACYNSLASNLSAQREPALAQPLYEKALAIRRRVLGDDHPTTAAGFSALAGSLSAQGKYAAAQPLYEKALEIQRHVLPADHPFTASTSNHLAMNLCAQGKYLEARDRWLSAVKGLDQARLQVAFTGLERAGGARESVRPALAAVLARLGQPARAWQTLEEDLGRGLLDELAARQDHRLAPADRDRLRELIAALERLDRLVETNPRGLDQAERARRFEDLKHQRELASIALGEFQTQLVRDHKAPSGRVATLDEIRAALPADAALVTWVDLPPRGPNAADPDGEHWGVVVRSRGLPAWVRLAGTGAQGRWTEDDTGLAGRVRTELRSRPDAGTAGLGPLVARLRAQRLQPMAHALDVEADGQPPALRLIVLPSRAMAGLPIDALLASDDTRTVSYAPSATVFKYLREQPRPDRHAGLLALGDPIYERPDASGTPPPPPDHGLLVNEVAPGSNAATHGLKPGDVLLTYSGTALRRREDLKAVPEPGRPVPIEIWRDGKAVRRDLAPGDLGVEFDPRPVREAIAANRAIDKVLVAARSGGEDFAPLPGTRHEVEALVRLFQADDRPARALLGADASEPELDHLAASGELGRFAFIHLATHGVIDEAVPARSAVILTQTGLPDPLEQALNHRPVFDGRLIVREIQRSWELKAELVTLSACETALGRESGGEGFVGFTQALLMSGTRSVVLSQWKVDDQATALLMARFYQDLLGKRPGLSRPMPKAEALHEAKQWLRNLTADEVGNELAAPDRGPLRPLAKDSGGAAQGASPAPGPAGLRPYAHPYYWAAFILVGDPD